MLAPLPCMQWLCFCAEDQLSTSMLHFQVFVLACLQASRRCAGGIVEALYNFKLVPDG